MKVIYQNHVNSDKNNYTIENKLINYNFCFNLCLQKAILIFILLFKFKQYKFGKYF